jgi:hypothetical protein
VTVSAFNQHKSGIPKLIQTSVEKLLGDMENRLKDIEAAATTNKEEVNIMKDKLKSAVALSIEENIENITSLVGNLQRAVKNLQHGMTAASKRISELEQSTAHMHSGKNGQDQPPVRSNFRRNAITLQDLHDQRVKEIKFV